MPLPRCRIDRGFIRSGNLSKDFHLGASCSTRDDHGVRLRDAVGDALVPIEDKA